LDLIWKPLGHERVIRFVLVDSERGKMILMCDDLTLSPEDIIIAYALRFNIEPSFNEQKNDNGCFSYRFWTKSLPKRKRWTKNNQPVSNEQNKHVEDAKRAIDSFICLGTISTGILTIIGFSHNRQIWKRYPGWLKTIRHCFPSIAVVKETLTQDFHAFLRFHPLLPICSIINNRARFEDFLYDDIA
jgi:hypothetical protein